MKRDDPIKKISDPKIRLPGLLSKNSILTHAKKN